MKNITIIAIIFVAIFLQIANEAYGQQAGFDNCHDFTPNGTKVFMKCHWGDEPLSVEEIITFNQDAANLYPGAIQWKDASAMYNCHSYAWWWTSSANNHAWMQGTNATGNNDNKYWEDGSYVPANWNSGTKISYENGDHSGNLIPSHPGWVYSKWGRWPVMIHWYLDSPYTDNVVRLYKRG